MVVLFKEYLSETIGNDYFDGYIPDGIEIAEIYLLELGEKDTYVIKTIQDNTVDQLITLAQSIHNHQKVKAVHYCHAYYLDSEELSDTDTEPVGDATKESLADTEETPAGEVGTESETAVKDVETVVETEEAAEKANSTNTNRTNANKLTGDSLIVYIILALFIASAASTVVVIRKGQRADLYPTEN